MTFIVVAGVLVALFAAAAFGLDRYGQNALEDRHFDVIVVAGCRVEEGGRPSASLDRRARLAVRLYRRGVAPRIAFTGGVGDHPPSEASVAASIATQLGVPQADIVLEERSTSTEENAAMLREIIGDASVVIVTDAFHVFRAERVFGRHFREARGVGTVGGRGVRIRGSIREVLALLGYGVMGRL